MIQIISEMKNQLYQRKILNVIFVKKYVVNRHYNPNTETYLYRFLKFIIVFLIFFSSIDLHVLSSI